MAEKGNRSHILYCFPWSNNNIGDMAICPGFINLLKSYIPGSKATIISRFEKGKEFNKTEKYLKLRYADINVIPHPGIANLRKMKGGEINLDSFLEKMRKKSPAFIKTLQNTDFLIYGSGTTLNYGRGNRRNWPTFIYYALPFFLADRFKIPFGIFGQSFEKLDPPVDHYLRELFAKASFLYTRDTDSLSYLKSLGIKTKEMGFMPDSTFAFPHRDEAWAEDFLKRNNLEPGRFITITIRTDLQSYIDRQRTLSHMKKILFLIETWIKETGMKVLICPEVRFEMKTSRRELYEKLPDSLKKYCVIMNHFWKPEEAISVYKKARVVISMEMHSIILALSVITPVLHPFFVEAGRKAHMLKDLKLDYSFIDIDKVTKNELKKRVFLINKDYQKIKIDILKSMAWINECHSQGMKLIQQIVNGT